MSLSTLSPRPRLSLPHARLLVSRSGPLAAKASPRLWLHQRASLGAFRLLGRDTSRLSEYLGRRGASLGAVPLSIVNGAAASFDEPLTEVPRGLGTMLHISPGLMPGRIKPSHVFTSLKMFLLRQDDALHVAGAHVGRLSRRLRPEQARHLRREIVGAGHRGHTRHISRVLWSTATRASATSSP